VADSVKRHIATREGLASEPCRLFADMRDINPTQDNIFLDIINRQGVGSSPEQAIAVVFEAASAENLRTLDEGGRSGEHE
jgi:anthranilate/para-aminobenzoate synthase component I